YMQRRHWLRRLWCNSWPAVLSLTIERGEGRHDGEVPGFGGAVRAAALRPRDHRAVRAVVSALQAQLPRPGGDDGRAWGVDGPHHDHALGASLCAGVRAPLEPLRAASWRVDETYVKVRGEWVYLYRAVDRAGNTIDFRLSPRRDAAAAKAFFRKAIKGQ